MDKVLIKPAKKGLVIRDQESKLILSAEGEKKVLNKFWRRRIKDGDVVVVASAKPAPKTFDVKKEEKK